MAPNHVNHQRTQIPNPQSSNRTCEINSTAAELQERFGDVALKKLVQTITQIFQLERVGLRKDQEHLALHNV